MTASRIVPPARVMGHRQIPAIQQPPASDRNRPNQAMLAHAVGCETQVIADRVRIFALTGDAVALFALDGSQHEYATAEPLRTGAPSALRLRRFGAIPSMEG